MGSAVNPNAVSQHRRRVPKVELLYFDGCPNHHGTAELVRTLARETGVDVDIELVAVPDAEGAKRLRFLGSPTLRVDGRDVEPGSDERTEYQHACRVYRTASGLRGQPDAEWIRDALRAAAGIGSATERV